MKMAAYDVDKFFTNSPPVVVLYYRIRVVSPQIQFAP